MKMSEVKTVEKLNVQSFVEPFEGVYIGSIQGEHGTNFRFFSEDQEFIVFGTKGLQSKMAQVEPGFAVRITFLGEYTTKVGHKYYDIKVEVSESPVDGFDITPFTGEQEY